MIFALTQVFETAIFLQSFQIIQPNKHLLSNTCQRIPANLAVGKAKVEAT